MCSSFELLLVNGIITRAATIIPLFLLGFEQGSHIAHLGLVLVHAVFIQANVFWNLPRWVEALTVRPLRIHLWHHTIERLLKPAQFSEQLGQGWASAWCLAWVSTRSWRSLTTCPHHQAQYSAGHKPCR